MNTMPPVAEMERAYLEREASVLFGRLHDGHFLPSNLPGAEGSRKMSSTSRLQEPPSSLDIAPAEWKSWPASP